MGAYEDYKRRKSPHGIGTGKWKAYRTVSLGNRRMGTQAVSSLRRLCVVPYESESGPGLQSLSQGAFRSHRRHGGEWPATFSLSLQSCKPDAAPPPCRTTRLRRATPTPLRAHAYAHARARTHRHTDTLAHTHTHQHTHTSAPSRNLRAAATLLLMLSLFCRSGTASPDNWAANPVPPSQCPAAAASPPYQ